MFTYKCTFKDYNGEDRTETFMFNLNKAELAEMQLTTAGGLEQRIRNIIEAKDTASIVKVFKSIILDSYGKKSEDGRNFIKSEELKRDFTCTEAYSDIFMKLSTDADFASEFLEGIIPPDMRDQITKLEVVK